MRTTRPLYRTLEAKSRNLVIARIAQACMNGAEVQLSDRTFKKTIACGCMYQVFGSGIWNRPSYELWLAEIGDAVDRHYAENRSNGETWEEILGKLRSIEISMGNFHFSHFALA